jgi:hypothetical protein
VGCIPDENFCRLNAAADRNLAELQKIIKTGYGTMTPSVGQINFDPLAQISEPVTLPGALNTGYPSICAFFAGDAGSDRLNRSLKAFKIPFGPEPDHTTTIRTAIKLEQQRAYESIKNCLSITMTP